MHEAGSVETAGRKGLWERFIQALTRTSLTAGLPQRVADLVRKKDRESEHLLILVQLILVGTLAALYLTAPRPADATGGLAAPVPLALLAYLGLTVFRGLRVRKAPLSGSGVALSIIADMALLFGVIWLFHITYRQPPAFSLKAPTFIYVFVFIAIRALRFDFRYVLVAGVVAAVGWTIVTLAAVSLSEEGTITRNFSDYLLSNRILIGAEFEKIFAVLAVTVIVALSAYRAERTLVAAVREEAANRELGRFFSHGVAEQIASADQAVKAGVAMERDAAILFLDIRGFTPFSMSVPPAQVVALLTQFHARIVPVVHAHNGVVDKFLGDGVMITFGAVKASERPAADALRALEAILVESEYWREGLRASGFSTPLTVNAAAAAGRVVFAAIGDEDRLEYTVIGEAVNLAAKLEKHNKVEASLALVPWDMFVRAVSQGFTAHNTPVRKGNATVAGASVPVDLAIWRAA